MPELKSVAIALAVLFGCVVLDQTVPVQPVGNAVLSGLAFGASISLNDCNSKSLGMRQSEYPASAAEFAAATYGKIPSAVPPLPVVVQGNAPVEVGPTLAETLRDHIKPVLLSITQALPCASVLLFTVILVEPEYCPAVSTV